MTENLSENERGSPPPNDYLAKLIQSVSSSDNTAEQPKDALKVSAPHGGDLISSLLSNPDLISKLPTLISTIKPILEILGGAPSSKTQETAPVSATPAQKPSEKSGGDRRSALLSAMKPYLSRERREAIDYIIKLSRLGDILKTL